MGQNAPSACFPDDTELGEVTNVPEGCAAIQKDLDRLGKWADRSSIRRSEKPCSWGEAVPGISTCWGQADGSSSAAKGLGALVDIKLNMSQQWCQSAGDPQHSWGCSEAAWAPCCGCPYWSRGGPDGQKVLPALVIPVRKVKLLYVFRNGILHSQCIN